MWERLKDKTMLLDFSPGTGEQKEGWEKMSFVRCERLPDRKASGQLELQFRRVLLFS